MQTSLLHLKPAYLQIAEPGRITSGLSSTHPVDQFGLSQQHSASQDTAVLCCCLSTEVQLAAAEKQTVMFIQLQTGFQYFPFQLVIFSLPFGFIARKDPALQVRGKTSDHPCLKLQTQEDVEETTLTH